VNEESVVADILVVDDSKVMRDMIVACLRPRADFTFTHASSGLEAIERLSLKRFDVVVLDLNMPDIGGIEVVEFVRGQDTLRDLPIIIVTTRGDDVSRTRSLEAGASRFMTKPFSPEQILQEVEGLLAPAPAVTVGAAGVVP
jgi:two-component system chemotaxis response regulator CheY